MKKLSLVLVLTLLVGLMAACSKPAEQEAPKIETPAATEKPAGEAPAAEEAYKWPVKTIEAIVPASAGGDTDFNARTMAKYFEKDTGVKMVVTNMAGGGGTIATSHVKEAKNDGSIMLFGHTGQVLVNKVAGLSDYSIEAYELAAIPAVEKSTVFAVSAKSGIKTAKDLVEKSKEKPLVYASELGGYSHLQALLFAADSGAKLDIVDVGSAAEKITNLLGGRVDIIAVPVGTIQDYLTTGEMVAVGQTSGEANPLLPEIPTIKSQGYDFGMDKPYIAAFPKGTDAEFVKQVSLAMEKVTKNPDYQKELEETYKQPVTFYNNEDGLTLLNGLLEEYTKYGDLLKK